MRTLITLDEAIRQLSQTVYHWPDEEEKNFFHLLQKIDPEYKHNFIKWTFESLEGFVDTRVKAGQLYFLEDPIDCWNTITALIISDDPDDRDTASLMIQELKDQRGVDLMKKLLYDRYPYIQFDAIESKLEKYYNDLKTMNQNGCVTRQTIYLEN